jgi:hypothetical protein
VWEHNFSLKGMTVISQELLELRSGTGNGQHETSHILWSTEDMKTSRVLPKGLEPREKTWSGEHQ